MILFPSWWCSCSERTETGTSAFSSMPSVRTPREMSQVRRAPLTTASTASLTVPPREFLIALKSARLALTTRKWRWGPIGTLSGLSGAGLAPAQANSASPWTPSLIPSKAYCGLVTVETTLRVLFTRALVALSMLEATIVLAPGERAGSHASSGCLISVPSGLRSKRTVARSTPDTPSISAWWVLERSAQRPSSSPSTIHSSHSGRSRSSCWEKTRETSRSSWRWSPGLGSAVWRTW